jgi:hypothetical protein
MVLDMLYLVGAAEGEHTFLIDAEDGR